jgi:hypothetical protein
MVIRWGLKRADEMGLESYIEATPEGKQCYDTFGFTVLEINEWHPPEKENPSKERKELEAKLCPFTWWSMCKPAKT